MTAWWTLCMIRDIYFFMCEVRRQYAEQRVLGKVHKAYFPVAQISNPTNLMLLMLYLDNVSLYPSHKIHFS
jgi:hypothetical protein